MRLIEWIQSQEPARPRSIDGRIPRDLETIVLKAIDKDPKRRYRSADELAEDLGRWVAGEPIQARRVSELERLWMLAVRHKTLALCLSILFVLVPGTVLSIAYAIRADRLAQVAFERGAEQAEHRVRHDIELADAVHKPDEADKPHADEAARQAFALGHRNSQGPRKRPYPDGATLQARRELARSVAEKALATAAAGAVDTGLFGLIDALEIAPDITPEDRAFGQALRRNLAAWYTKLPMLRLAVDDVGAAMFLEPDGIVLAYTTHGGRRLRRLNLVTGRGVGEPDAPAFPEPIVAISSDGQVVATCQSRDDGPDPRFILRVREADTGLLRHEFPGVEGVLERVAIAPDPTHLVGTFREGRSRKTFAAEFPRRVPGGGLAQSPCRIWHDQLPADDRLRILVNAQGLVIVAAAPDQRYPSATAPRLHFLNLSDEIEQPGVDLVWRGTARGPGWIALERTLLTIDPPGRIAEWRKADGLLVSSWRPDRADHGATVTADDWALIVGCADHRVRYYDLATHQECGPAVWLPEEAPVARSEFGAEPFQFSPAGTFCLVRRGRSAGIWQVPGPLRSRQIEVARYLAWLAIDDSPRSREAAINRETGPREALASRMMAHRFGSVLPGGPASEWTMRSDSIAPRGVPVPRFDPQTRRLMGRPQWPAVDHSATSRDGRLLATARAVQAGQRPGQVVTIIEPATGRVAGPLIRSPWLISCLAISPDGGTLAVGTMEGTELYEIARAQRTAFLASPGPVQQVVYSPDRRWMAVCSRGDKSDDLPSQVQVWDIATGRTMGPPVPLRFDEGFPDSLRMAFTPDSLKLIVVDERAVQIEAWDTVTGRFGAPQLLTRHDAMAGGTKHEPGAWIFADRTVAALRPDGVTLAFRESLTGIRQVDVATGQALGPVLAHPAPLSLAAYSPDGATLVVACLDGTVRFWDTATGMPVGPDQYAPLPVIGLEFTPDGARLRVTRLNGTTRIWPVLAPVPREDPGSLRAWIETTAGILWLDGDRRDALDFAAWRSARLAADSEPNGWPSPPAVGELLQTWHDVAAAEAAAVGERFAADWHRERLSVLRTMIGSNRAPPSTP